MEKVITFLQNRPDISVRQIERELDLPNATINLRKGTITTKHLDTITDYLIEHFGYESGSVDLIGNKDNPIKDGVIIKKYNQGRIPGFKDDIARFRDPDNGLWKRFNDWGMRATKEGRVAINGYEPATGEELEDKIGRYYLTTNGTKVYVSYN